jgi:hypothetical protein
MGIPGKIDKAKSALLSWVTLQQLQALTELLNFLAKALPSGRAFISGSVIECRK